MARISTYIKDDRVSVKDILIGSDGDKNNTTKNFSITGISDFILGQLKNSGVIFRFSDTSTGSQIGDEGYFFSEGNITDKTQVTKFYFSKTSYFGEVLTELFTSVGSNLGDLYLGLSQQDDSANYGFFNVANIISVDDNYFEVEASLRGAMFAKSFQVGKNYSLFFDLASTNEFDIDVVNGVFQLYKNGAMIKTVDLSIYLDDTNLSRLVSGVVDEFGIATFTRDDGSSFDVDFSTFMGGVVPTRTSDLINDGDDGVNPFVSANEVYIKSEVDNKDAFIQTQVTKLNGLYLERDLTLDLLYLKNADGDILSSIPDTNPDGIGYTIEFDSDSRSILLRDADGNIVDTLPVSVFVADNKLDTGGYEGSGQTLYDEILVRAAAAEQNANAYTDSQIAALDLDFVRSVNNIFPDVNGNVQIDVYDIPRDGIYPDITAMIADQNNQQEGFIYEVTDASADPSPDIDEGKAWYWYEGTTTGTITDYTLLSSEDLLNLTSQELLNKIGYTPEDVANKATDFSVLNDILYPTVSAVDTRITDQLAGLRRKSDKTVSVLQNTMSYATVIFTTSIADDYSNAFSSGYVANHALAKLTDGSWRLLVYEGSELNFVESIRNADGTQLKFWEDAIDETTGTIQTYPIARVGTKEVVLDDGTGEKISVYPIDWIGGTITPAPANAVWRRFVFNRDLLGSEGSPITGGASNREVKLITNTTQYTVVAEDFISKKLVFTAEGDVEIDVIINNGVAVDNSAALEIISAGNHILNFVAGAGVTLTPTKNCILKTIGIGSIVSVSAEETASEFVVAGSLQYEGELSNSRPIKIISASTYTLIAEDKGAWLRFNSPSPVTVTVPDLVFSADDEILGDNEGAGEVTFQAGAGVSLDVNPMKLPVYMQDSVIGGKFRTASNIIIFGQLKPI